MKQFSHTYLDTGNLIEFMNNSELTTPLLVHIFSSDMDLSENISREIQSVNANATITLLHSDAIDATDIQFTTLPEHTQIVNKTHHKEYEELYAGIINTTTEGFWLLAPDLTIIDANYSLCVMLGYSKDEIIGRLPFDFIDNKDQELCRSQADLIDDVSSRTYELVFMTKNGAQLHTITNATTMHDQHGNKMTYAFMTDISARKKIEDDLIRRKEEIKQLNSSLESRIRQEVEKNRQKDHMMYQQSRLASMGEMIGNIAHQWRQPLNIMALVMQDIYISDQLGSLTSKKIADSYEKSNNLLQYMSQTIDDFRNFFKHSDSKEEFSLKDAVDSVCALVSTNLNHNNIECNINIKQDSLILGCSNEFKQVLVNIMNNAQEAIQSNGGEEKLINIIVQRKGSNALVKISDNGGGISQDIIAKVYDPYFTTKNQTQGTGLGLYMSKQIIENIMCGSLSVKNKAKGAEFTIELPIKDV